MIKLRSLITEDIGIKTFLGGIAKALKKFSKIDGFGQGKLVRK